METGTQQSTPIWLTIAIGIVIPLLTAYIGWQAGNNSINKDYVQIASQIAQSKDSPKPLKKWAAKLLNEMSPVPFSEGVEESIAVYAASDSKYEDFIFLSKDILKESWAQPCQNFDSIFEGNNISNEQIARILSGYKECELRMSSMIKMISKMKNVSDEIASENRQKDEAAKTKAGDPFAE
jgi:hypothetical protein